jgi:hypothetical protein
LDLDPTLAFGAGLGSGIMLWGSWASGSDSIGLAAGVHGDPGLGKEAGVCRGLEKVVAGEETGANSPSLKSKKIWVLEP